MDSSSLWRTPLWGGNNEEWPWRGFTSFVRGGFLMNLRSFEAQDVLRDAPGFRGPKVRKCHVVQRTTVVPLTLGGGCDCELPWLYDQVLCSWAGCYRPGQQVDWDVREPIPYGSFGPRIVSLRPSFVSTTGHLSVMSPSQCCHRGFLNTPRVFIPFDP